MPFPCTDGPQNHASVDFKPDPYRALSPSAVALLEWLDRYREDGGWHTVEEGTEEHGVAVMLVGTGFVERERERFRRAK